jgi:hypothetical protein
MRFMLPSSTQELQPLPRVHWASVCACLQRKPDFGSPNSTHAIAAMVLVDGGVSACTCTGTGSATARTTVHATRSGLITSPKHVHSSVGPLLQCDDVHSGDEAT